MFMLIVHVIACFHQFVFKWVDF